MQVGGGRRSIRLRNYDYALPGAYFVTICVAGRKCPFGEIAQGEMHLNAAGEMASEAWQALTQRFAGLTLDAFVVMPNHVHGIIVLGGDKTAANAPEVETAVASGAHRELAACDRADVRGCAGVGAGLAHALARGCACDPHGVAAGGTPTLGRIVGAYKSSVAWRYVHGVRMHDWPPFRASLWQRNYYEHVIRDDASFDEIRQYVVDNPLAWSLDRENPSQLAGNGAADNVSWRV